MALLAWLPLNGDTKNYGCEEITCEETSLAFSSDIRKTGKSMNGGSLKITVPSLDNSTEWSLAFWGKINSSKITSDWVNIVSISDGGANLRIQTCKKDSGNKNYCFTIHNNAGSSSTVTGNQIINSSKETNVNLNDTWIHVVLTCTKSGNAVKQYINGKLHATFAYTGSGSIKGIFSFLNNSMIEKSDIRIFDKPISLGEVKEIYRALILHYTFEDKDPTFSSIDSNIVHDISGFQNHGTIKGTVSFTNIQDQNITSHGIGELAATFSGSGFIKSVSTAKITDSITVSAWAYRDSWATFKSDSDGRFFSSTESGGWNICPVNVNGNAILRAYLWTGSYSTIDGPTADSLSSGWHLFSITYDKSSFIFYIDGISVGSKTISGSKSIGYNSNDIFVGAEPNGSNTAASYFKGKIADFRIYATALTADEIKSLYSVKTKIYRNGAISTNKIKEFGENIIWPITYGIETSNTSTPCVSFYRQSNLTCSFINDSIHIYSPPNITEISSGTGKTHNMYRRI